MAPVYSDHMGELDGESSGDESSQSSSGGSGERSGGRARSASRSSRSSRSGSSRSGSASSSGSGGGSDKESKANEKVDAESSDHSPHGSPAKSRSRSRSKSSGRSSKSPRLDRSGSRSKSRSRSPRVTENGKVDAAKDADTASNAASPRRSHSRSRSRSRSKSPASRRSRSRSTSVGAESSVVGAVDGESKTAEDKKPAADTTQLFGDADDISDDDQDSEVESKKDEAEAEVEPEAVAEAEAKSDKSVKSDAEEEEKKSEKEESEGEAERVEEKEEPLPETRIDVEIPKISTDLGKGIHFVKLPNFLSVETRPFDPNTYEDEIDEEETLDEEGRARLKLKVENTIRWRERFNEKNVFVKESNARFVRWSDGSMSLHLGSEIFNVHKQPLQGDHNHLFIRQGTGLQGQAVFRTKLTFRPHSTESFTHRKMTMSLADRSQKTSGIKVLSIVGHDPEAQRFQMIKREEDKLKASVRRENKQRRVRERATSRGLTSSYLEPDRYDNDEFSDEDNAISLSAIKNRYKKNAKMHSNIYSSDEDDDMDEEDGVKVVKKSERPKRLKDSDEESEANDGGGDDGDNSPVVKDDGDNDASNSD